MSTQSNSVLKLCVAGAITAVLMLGTASVAIARPAHNKITVVAPTVDPDALTTRVSYADLNLASVAGEKILNRRVGSAVHTVCAPMDNALFRFEHSACTSIAWNGARPQMSLAVARAREIAATGSSTIAAVAITISAPQQ